MKKIIILMAMAVLLITGCSSENSVDNGKPPVVTIREDGSVHIDRLDPGESVELIIEIPVESPKEEEKDEKTNTDIPI